MVSNNIGNNNTSSINNDALSNTASIGIDDILTQVRKNKHKNIFPTYQRNIQRRHQYFSPDASNKNNNPDNNTDAEEWKLGTSLIIEDSMVAGLREAKLSRNRKVKVRYGTIGLAEHFISKIWLFCCNECSH